MPVSLRLLLATHLAVLVLVPAACLPQDGTGTSASSSGGGSGGASGAAADGGAATLAGKACLDTVEAFAKAQQRCGNDLAAARNAALRDLANGDCESVTIRNERELRAQCLPSLASISCADLANQRFAPSCAEQIVRSK